MLGNTGCLWIKDRARILGWELVNKGRGASEAKQLCGNPVREHRIEEQDTKVLDSNRFSIVLKLVFLYYTVLTTHCAPMQQ